MKRSVWYIDRRWFPTQCTVMAISSEDRKHFEEMGELYVRRAMQITDRFPFPLKTQLGSG
jgi:hypothetical protein